MPLVNAPTYGSLWSLCAHHRDHRFGNGRCQARLSLLREMVPGRALPLKGYWPVGGLVNGRKGSAKKPM